MNYATQLRQQNKMLVEMQNAIDSLANSMKGFTEKEKEFTKETKKAKEQQEKLNKELVTREETLSKAFEKLKEGGLEVKKFEIFSKKSFRAFIDAGGNAFDFFDLALSSANQRVKIFGVEAALARKVMYGFFPPGMFRLVNKISTSFRFLGGIFRKTGEDGENIDNIFKKMARGLISLPKLMKMKKGDFDITSKIKSGFEETKRIGRVSKGFGVAIGKEKERVRDAGRQMAKGKITEDEFTKIREAAQEQIKLLEEARDKSIETSRIGKFTNKFIKGLKAAPKFIGKALLFFAKIMLYATLFLAIAYILWKTVGKTIIEALQAAWPAIEMAGSFIVTSIMMIWDGVQKIFYGFFGEDGSLNDVIQGVIDIFLGVVALSLSVAGTLLVALGGFVIEFIKIGLTKLVAFLTDAFSSLEGFLKAIPIILLVVGGIVAFIMGAPVWLAVTIGLVLYKVAAFLIEKFANIVPGFSTGGTSMGGMAVVGEKGPELVSLPRGSRVYSNAKSRQMTKASNVNNFNITINAKDTSKSEMRRIAKEIGNMINKEVNRGVSSSTTR